MRDDGTTSTGDEPERAGQQGDVDWSAPLIAGRYRLGDAIGQGAMAGVFRADDLRLHREVAIKLFHPGQDAQVRSRFGAEAMALARLSHPGLVAIYDAGIDVVHADRPYLVMQLIDGDTLRDRLLDAGPLAPHEMAALGARLAAALAHVHDNDVVHRDVKPANIVLDAEGSPYLADFGIALLVDAARMTGSNEILGTAAYLSPEQILGVEVGASCDVYSLGLVLLECLTGELEYPGVSKVESALARLHRPPRIPAALPAGMAELLAEMTAIQPEARPDAAECATRLAALADPARAAVPAPSPVPAVPKERHKGWRPVVIAGSGLVAAATAAVWMLTTLLPQTGATAPDGAPNRPPAVSGAPSNQDGHPAGPGQLPGDAALTGREPPGQSGSTNPVAGDPTQSAGPGSTGPATGNGVLVNATTSGTDSATTTTDTSTAKHPKPPGRHKPVGGGGGGTTTPTTVLYGSSPAAAAPTTQQHGPNH